MPRMMERLGLDKLSIEDRRVLLEELQDSVDVEPPVVHEWHMRLVRERIAAYEADPSRGIPAEEFFAKLRAEREARRRAAE